MRLLYQCIAYQNAGQQDQADQALAAAEKIINSETYVPSMVTWWNPLQVQLVYDEVKQSRRSLRERSGSH